MEHPDFSKCIVVCHEDYYGVKYEYFDAGEWGYYYTTEEGSVIIYRCTGKYSKETRELKIKWWAYFDDICKKYEGDGCLDVK